jgi:hypothetical protein
MALTPCMPCSFGLLLHPRSGSRSPAQRSSRVTVIVRSIPLVTAAYGTGGHGRHERRCLHLAAMAPARRRVRSGWETRTPPHLLNCCVLAARLRR